MSKPWPHSMTVDRYAAFERATGMKVTQVNNIWWHQVRPFLYRPLLPYKRYDLKKARARLPRLGIFQYGIADEQACNSHLNPIIFDDLQSYDIKNLRYSVRKHIKKALNHHVTISRIVDEGEFSKAAYPCYLSFYERTKYGFDKQRRQKEGFSQWSHTLYEFPEVLIHGAFLGQELISFEITCLVEDTLILKTLVNSDQALQCGAADLLLHTYRMSAREQPEIKLIYDSMLGQSSGINDYYLIRGARVLAVPAILDAPPALLWLIRRTSKKIYGRLVGLGDEEIPPSNLTK